MPESRPAKADQIAFWNEDAGPRWVALQSALEPMLAPFGDALLALADANPGEDVIDVGCGYGTMAIALARRVGPEGSVLGVDVSRPLLASAESLIAAEQVGNVRLLQADASRHAFAPGAVTLVTSRFGVMFFEDPIAAFANLRRALHTGGRLAFICWRGLAENPCFALPAEAARPHLPPAEPFDATAPGQFSLADPQRVRRILEAAGFGEVTIAAYDTTLALGSLDQALRYATQMGPVSRLLAGASDEVQSVVRAAIATAFERHEGPEGVRLAAAAWLVGASA